MEDVVCKKKEPVIYLLCGKPKSGKDVAATIIQKYYGLQNKKTINLQYSSYVKKYAESIMGWDGKEQTKPRDFLNYLGTEIIKDTIDPEFSLQRTLQDIEVYSYFFDTITISDVRFVDEIEVPKKRFSQVISIYIESPVGEDALAPKASAHRTNHGLDHYHNYDYYINNDTSMEALEEKIIKILKEVEKDEH